MEAKQPGGGGKAQGGGAAAKGRRSAASKVAAKASKPGKPPAQPRNLSIINLDSTSEEESDGERAPSRARRAGLPAAAAADVQCTEFVTTTPGGGSVPAAAEHRAAVSGVQAHLAEVGGPSAFASPQKMQGSPSASTCGGNSPLPPLPHCLSWPGAGAGDMTPSQLQQPQGDEEEADVPATPPSQVCRHASYAVILVP